MPLCKKNKQVAEKSPFPSPMESIAIHKKWPVLARYYVWDVIALPPGFLACSRRSKTNKKNNNSVSHAVLRSVLASSSGSSQEQQTRKY